MSRARSSRVKRTREGAGEGVKEAGRQAGRQAVIVSVCCYVCVCARGCVLGILRCSILTTHSEQVPNGLGCAEATWGVGMHVQVVSAFEGRSEKLYEDAACLFNLVYAMQVPVIAWVGSRLMSNPGRHGMAWHVIPSS